MAYGFVGTMKTKPGCREAVVQLLVQGSEALREHHCHAYVVGVADNDDVTIWVSEVWRSKEDHDASLQLPETRAAIEKAMPMLTGEFDSNEITVVGGLGAGPA